MAAGTSPVPYFPTREKTFGGWETVDARPNYVVFDHLLVHPKQGSQTSASIFAGEVVKSGSHWLVNRLYTIAVMKRPTKTGTHQVGPQDYAAPGASSGQGSSQTSGGTLGKQWLLVVVGLIGLALLFPLGFGIASALRSRRSRMQYTAAPSPRLPPLPRSLQTSSAPISRPAALTFLWYLGLSPYGVSSSALRPVGGILSSPRGQRRLILISSGVFVIGLIAFISIFVLRGTSGIDSPISTLPRRRTRRS